MDSTLPCNEDEYNGHPIEQDLQARLAKIKDVRDAALKEAVEEFDTNPPKRNTDEERFKRVGFPGFASFTKALKHDTDGLIEWDSFNSLLSAISTGTQAAFNDVELGGGKRLLGNPLNAYSFQLIGNDSNGARMAPAPSFSSRSTAIDMVERYWMALCRDIRFDQYEKNPLIQEACDDLNAVGFEQEFGFNCSPKTIFRGPYEGCDVGPHVSQFLLQDFNFGNQPIRQSQFYPREGLDYLTDLETWKKVNNGDINPTGSDILDGTRYIITLRDAGQWVHIDFPHQAGLWSTIILLGQMAMQSAANPYVSKAIKTSEPFGSLGGPDITIHSGLAGVYALKHAWFQKWCVHRRLRPEVYAQRLELFRRGILGKPFDEKFNQLFGEGAEVWQQTRVLEHILEHNRAQNIKFYRKDKEGTWLLPMGFPEGSPTHPAYPGGHSAFVAAGATIAKAFFADCEIASPQVPRADGQALVSFAGGPLKVHGELNKLIANVTLFRDGAGMHWRTDGTTSGCPGTTIPTGGNLLGEKMAISMLRDLKRTYREEVGTFEFKSITGHPIRI